MFYEGQYYGYFELLQYPQVTDNGATANTVSGQYGNIWALMSEQNDKVFIAQEGENDSFSRAWKAKKDAGYPQAEALAAGKVNSIPNFTKDSAPK